MGCKGVYNTRTCYHDVIWTKIELDQVSLPSLINYKFYEDLIKTACAIAITRCKIDFFRLSIESNSKGKILIIRPQQPTSPSYVTLQRTKLICQ